MSHNWEYPVKFDLWENDYDYEKITYGCWGSCIDGGLNGLRIDIDRPFFKVLGVVVIWGADA